MKKALNLNDFTLLLIATLANNSPIIDFIDYDRKIAVIPTDYKQRIENILCTENGWKEEFSTLINLDEYFKDHFAWEQKLSMQIKKIIDKSEKKVEFDLLRDSFNIPFDKSEIKYILSYYKDDNIKNTMIHFTELLTDYIYSREFQERFDDYCSKSVQYMKKLKKDKFTDTQTSI